MADKTKYNGWDERLFKAVNNDPCLPEVFRSLRSKILFSGDGKRPPKTLMITSVAPGEGKSFVAANLAISLARGLDQYSLLVDCDLRRPSLASMIGMDAQPGLADYLAGRHEIPELIRKSPIDKLSILPSGAPPSNPAELLSSEKMKRLVAELAERYEDRFIIFDTPPAGFASESIVLARLVDAVIIVVREGGAKREDISKVAGIIGQERILGLVYNGQTRNFMEPSIIQSSAGYYGNPADS